METVAPFKAIIDEEKANCGCCSPFISPIMNPTTCPSLRNTVLSLSLTFIPSLSLDGGR